MGKSKKPSGLSLTRSRGKFTCSWKRGGSYKAQKYQQKIDKSGKDGKWESVSVGKSTTSKKITIDPKDYYPLKSTILKSVSFRVKGKLSKYTAYSSKTMEMEPPAKPMVGYAQESAYSTSFIVEANRHINDKKYWGTYIEYQTALVIDKNYKNQSEVSEWGEITRKRIYDPMTEQDTTSFTELITETSEDINRITAAVAKKQSAVRWFRGRVSGPGGPSEWVGKCISYSESKPTYDVSSTIIDNERGGYTCIVDWKYIRSISFPIDAMKIQYAFAVPDRNMKPVDPNVQDAVIGGNNTIVPNTKNDNESIFHERISFEINGKVDLDQLVYIRINVEHNGITTYGNWVYCRDNSGSIPNAETMLKPPTINSVEPAESGNKVILNISNNSEVKGVFLVIRFIGSGGAEDTKDIGVINTKDEVREFENQVFEIPPDYPGDYQIGAYAAVDNNLKNYYTLVGEEVENPVDADIDTYYEKDSNDVYSLSRDLYLKEYYTLEGTQVVGPTEEDLDTYYELIEGIYVSTEDDEVDPEKTYYTVVGTKVDDPDESELSTYYEYIHGIWHDESEPVAYLYEHTTDIILYGKTYYTVTGTLVDNPDAEYLNTYYNYLDGVYYLTSDTVLYGKNAERVIVGPGVGYDVYTVTSIMKSTLETHGAEVIKPPVVEDISLEHLGDGNVKISWKWDWKEVDAAEIAWSDFNEALFSTDPPQSYMVYNSQSNYLIIKGLELGVTWYFWIRLIKEGITTSWSDVKSLSLSTQPNIAVLTLSKNFITMGEKFSANWSYVTTDNTEQSSAKICLCDVDENGNVTYGRIIATINGATQYHTFDTAPVVAENEEGGTSEEESMVWETGKSYNLALMVCSASGQESTAWSDYRTVTIVDPITCSIDQTNLIPSASDYDSTKSYSVGDYAIVIKSDPEDETQQVRILMKCVTAIPDGEEWDESHWIEDENYPCQELHELSEDNPLELVISASTGQENIISSSIIIMRAYDYFVDRPDNGTYGGYAGEIVYQRNDVYHIDEDEEVVKVEITLDDIISYNSNLDDTSHYYLIASVTDNHNQSATAGYLFKVNWSHQAVMPVATVEMGRGTKINISNPEGSAEGDYCDIYRMSADGITLIYPHAELGQTYVDPYPTIGDQGGYRVVYRTYNGDYIINPIGDDDDDEDDDGSFAWIDFLPEDGYIFDSISNIINFDDNVLEIKYNVDMDNSWRKDFQSTKYLGGTIQGDFNAGVERTGSISTDIQTNDTQTIRLIKELATYEGLCHVRTKDGSNYIANVEVNENVPYQPYYDKEGKFTKLGSYSFSITKVDPQSDYDGMTLAEWLDDQS